MRKWSKSRQTVGDGFAPHAWVLLGRGDWTLKWDVGVSVTIFLQPLLEDDETLSDVADQPRRAGGMATIVPEPLRLTDLEHRNMATLFAYLIRREPEPKEIYAEAARVLGGDPKTRKRNRVLVKAQLPKVARRINRMRNEEDAMFSPEDVGRYLVDFSEGLRA